MKKLITLLLVAVMTFSLVACGGNTTEEINGTTNQTTNETNEQNNADNSQQESVQNGIIGLVGTWVGTWGSDTETLILNDDGTGSFDHEAKIIEILWELKENELELRSAESFEVEGTKVYSWFHFTIITQNDTIELKSNDSDLVLTQETKVDNSSEENSENSTLFVGVWTDGNTTLTVNEDGSCNQFIKEGYVKGEAQTDISMDYVWEVDDNGNLLTIDEAEGGYNRWVRVEVDGKICLQREGSTETLVFENK